MIDIKNECILFSVIVPAYNSAEFIKKCIDSVLTQTYPNFELILVDDGSNDDTLKICIAYEKEDCRVKVIHKENGGHTSARNEGIKRALGEYILFLDSDDWISADVLEICEEKIRNNLPDVLIYRIYNTRTKEYFANNILSGFYENEIYRSKVMSSLIMDENGCSVFAKSLSGKVLKRELIIKNQLKVPHELRIAEDAAAFVGTMMEASSVYVIPDATYFCCVREESVSRSSDKDAFFRLPFMFAYYKAKLSTCSFDFSQQFDRYIVAQLYTAALLVMRSGGKSKDLNLGLEKVLEDPVVSTALKRAKFNLKGYKFMLKKFILRHRLWRLAMLLDR